MKSLILVSLGLLFGIALIATGIYYLIQEKDEKDSVKIYGTCIAVGAVITIGIVIKLILAGF